MTPYGTLTWEQITDYAKRTTERPTRDGALLLASYVLDFDAAVKRGDARLPHSWEPTSVHLAGYEDANQEASDGLPE